MFNAANQIKAFEDENRTQQEFTLRMPAPYADWQRELITEQCKLIVEVHGTKAGKTFGLASRVTVKSFEAPAGRGALYRVIAPTTKLSGITFRYIHRFLPPTAPYETTLSPEENAEQQEIWEDSTPERRESTQTFRWRHNDAKIVCMHGQDPETHIEGEGTQGNVIDEAAKCAEGVFASVTSTTTQTGGWIACGGTPRGKNWYFQLYMKIRDHMDECEARGIPYRMICRSVPTHTSPFVRPSVIEQARNTLPDRLFRQLYLAEFVDEGAVIPRLDVAFGGARVFDYGLEHMPERHDSKSLYVGVDWAKRKDYTVFTALNEKGQLVAYKRLQRLDYVVQVQMLFTWVDQLRRRNAKDEKEQTKPVTVNILHDQTGVGEAISDIINKVDRGDLTVRGVVWNNSSKEFAVNDLILSMEEEALKFPPWGTLQQEMAAFEVTSTATGLPRYGAPAGLHDDTVMSLVLSNMLFRELREKQTVMFLLDPIARKVEFFTATGQWDEIEDMMD